MTQASIAELNDVAQKMVGKRVLARDGADQVVSDEAHAKGLISGEARTLCSEGHPAPAATSQAVAFFARQLG